MGILATSMPISQFQIISIKYNLHGAYRHSGGKLEGEINSALLTFLDADVEVSTVS